MTRKRIIIISIVSLIFVVGFAACSNRFHHRGLDRFDVEAMVERAADKLDLTEPQQADLYALGTELLADAKAMRAERHDHLEELLTMIRSDKIDRAQVDANIAGKREKITAIIDKAADRLIAFHATLTPEQRATLADHIEKRATDRGCFSR